MSTSAGTATETEPEHETGTGTGFDAAPEDSGARAELHRQRESLLPALAAALSVKGTVYTGTGSKGETPPELHPLVEEFLQELPADQRERWSGRCPEAVLLSQHLNAAEGARGKLAARRPYSVQDARKSLKGARVTTRRIREDGDPEHGTYQAPCRSCEALLGYFGVDAVAEAG